MPPTASRDTLLIAAIFFAAILASLGVALVALVKRGDGGAQTMLTALSVRVGLSVLFFLLLMLGWYFGVLEPHGLGR
jgi:Protein of unknown function (DUF2909)